MPAHGGGSVVPSNYAPATQPGAQASQDLRSAAQANGIPLWVLAGVYGLESSFGKAYGPGQKTYGYFGLTSPGLWNPNMTFAQDANASAQLLATLYHQHGNNWDAALKAYSGGGYGASQAQAMATKWNPNVGPNVVGAVGSVASTIAGAITSVPDFLSKLTDPHTWLRVAMFLGAFVLITFALLSLSGQTGRAQRVARSVAHV